MVKTLPSVLIVDDNADVRAALRSFLRQRIATPVCCEASDGAEAVRQAMLQKPALILMDLSMPNMNGVEAAASIKKALPDTKIVMFTLHASQVGRLMAKAAGVDIVVGKSEGSDGLLRALENFLFDN